MVWGLNVFFAIKNISRHNINYAIDLFFFFFFLYKTFWIHRLFFNTRKLKVSHTRFRKLLGIIRSNFWSLHTNNKFLVLLRREYAEISRFCKSLEFERILPSRLVLEKQAKLNFEAEIPFVWRADEWASGNFERIPNSQLTASGFVFPDPVSCETAQPIRASRLNENLVAEKTLSFRLITTDFLSTAVVNSSSIQYYFCRWKFTEISGK